MPCRIVSGGVGARGGGDPCGAVRVAFVDLDGRRAMAMEGSIGKLGCAGGKGTNRAMLAALATGTVGLALLTKLEQTAARWVRN